LVVAGLLPAAMLSLGVERYMMNHFFVRPPYLLDSGFYSAVMYRSGPGLHTASISCDYATSLWSLHISPLVGVWSALSYVFPIQRIEWFVIFETLIFLPLGFATYFLSAQVDPSTRLRRLPVTLVAALAFSFSGFVISLIGYPHIEALIPGLFSLLLVCVATGRTRVAWVLLFLSVSIREDVGLHLALALSPLLYLNWRGRPLAVSRRTLVAMIGAAFAFTVADSIVSKLFFHPVDLVQLEYLGHPIYSHLSLHVLATRVSNFIDNCGFIYLPFLVTCAIALIRRDAAYLLGWAVTAPWFLLNFLAADPGKVGFIGYTGFPFVVSMFWVYLYGALLAPPDRRVRAWLQEAVFAVVCVTSTIGLYRGDPSDTRFVVEDMAVGHHRDRAAVHAFVDSLHTERAKLGHLYVDYAVAALALEWLDLSNSWHPGVTPVDTVAFHRDSAMRDGIMADMIANQVRTCSRVLETGIFVCSREPLPADMLPGRMTPAFPSSLVLAPALGGATHLRKIQIDSRGVVLLEGYSLGGTLTPLPKGTYEWTLTFATDDKLASDTAFATVGVWLPGIADPVASARATAGAPAVTLHFQCDGSSTPMYGVDPLLASSLVITSADLRRVGP
jgi:hypothetical protein